MNTEAPYLIVETDGNKRFLLQDPTTLGRLPENDLPFDDAGCSSRHAVLRREGGRWSLEDLGSTNGTWVNGQRLEQPHPLKEGDRIQVGAQVLKVGGLESHCPKCGKELPLAAVFCPSCGLQLGNTAPSTTVAMTLPSTVLKVPPPLPQPAPPPLPSVPAAPVKKKNSGCWLSCCLVSVVLLILAGIATWFFWDRFSGQGPTPLLGKTLEFRQTARFNTPQVVADWAKPKAQERFKGLDENL